MSQSLIQSGVGIGIIGAGVISGQYLQPYSKDPRVGTLAIADTNTKLLEKISRQYDPVITASNYKELILNDKIDIIVVATPHFLHHPMVMQALDAGKHVICEKPLALDAIQAREMIDKAKKKNLHLLVGLNWRCNPQIRTVEKVINNGMIGQPFMGKISYMGHEIPRLKDPDNWKGTKAKAGGGVLLDGGYHVIDVMNMLFGSPTGIKAVSGQYVVKNADNGEDNALLLFEYPADLACVVSGSFTTKFANSKKGSTLAIRLEVYGTEGSIWAEYLADPKEGWQINLISSDEKQKIETIPYKPENLPVHFLDCIIDGTDPVVTAEDALKVHEIVDKVYWQA